MAFIPNDLYLTSGSVGIINSWTPTVTKFDTSTFYNWEQDNEPLYDLDERTQYLWEKLGYPTQDGASSITGKVFVVSADAAFPTGDSNGIIFRDLSTVISVLPNPITYPIIIEVASFGDLGDLNLKNIKIDESCEGAGLEIINRNFGRTLAASGAIFDGSYPDYFVSSTDLYNTLTTTKSIRLNTNVISGTSDSRWSNSRGFLSPIGMGTTNYGIGNVYLHFKGGLATDTTNKVRVNLYTNSNDATIADNDFTQVSSYSTLAFGNTAYTNTAPESKFEQNTKCFAAIYGNFLGKVKIENCGGPIYIRNFCVDGARSTQNATLDYSTDSGFEIINSNVYLENCFAIRCNDAGFNFSNSDIKVRRGIFGMRNYPMLSDSARDTSKLGVGLLAVNSKITVESQTNPVLVSGIDIPITFGYNDIGIKLVNSDLLGGDGKEIAGTLASETGVGMLTVINNTDCGLVLENSVYDYAGITNALQNYNGIQITNSIAKFPMLNVAYSQNVGLYATNSKIVQNPKVIKIISSEAFSDNASFDIEQIYFGTNGQHLILDNSVFTYENSTDMPSKFGTSLFHSSFGWNDINGSITQKPAVEVVNNSYAEFVNAKIQVLSNDFVPYSLESFYSGGGLFGACIRVDNNSKAKLISCVTAPTILLGPDGSDRKVAVAYANQNSEIEFNGNTLIAQGGVDVLVDNNSTVRFNPHKTKSGSLDASSWSLGNGNNHTKVELLSTRSCLVADNNSNIIMEHLGDVHAFWPASQTSSIDYNQSNIHNVSAYTCSGYMQFYPNGQDSVAVDGQATYGRSLGLSYTQPNARVYASGSHEYFLVNYKSANASSDIAGYSTGGMCVRALHGSKVKVFNVHFPTAWPVCNGQIYDVSSSLHCDKLRIWNICDNSELEAAYCVVSGLYPSAAGYKGPSAVYLSGAGIIASGAPSSTPDTGRLSVLDWYGASGANTGTNYGAFRLYFSPNGRAKFLTTLNSSTSDSGQVYQLISQGYNPSSYCSSVSNSLSSIYSDITSSAFYYISAMMDSGFATRVRLDESAANTFANAKHNAIAKSGRIPLTTIYSSKSSSTIGSQAYDAPEYGRGKGFKSSEIFDLRRDN